MNSCISKRTGRPLTTYHTLSEAREAVKYIQKTYHGQEQVPYKCDRCGYWHLAPLDRQTPSKPCPICRGRDGKAKAGYTSESDALQRAKILGREKGVRLTVYACEHGNGWHLTSS